MRRQRVWSRAPLRGALLCMPVTAMGQGTLADYERATTVQTGQTVRVGMVGAGWVSRHHLDAW